MSDSKAHQLRNVSFIEEEIKSNMNSLQSSYIQLSKGLEGLSRIDQMPLSEFKQNKSEFSSRKEEVDKALESINHLIKTLQTTEITKEDLKKKANSIIIKIQSQLNTKLSDYNRMKQSIEGRQKHFINEDTSENALFNDTKFNFKDYGDDKEHNDKRIQELEHIKRTSAEVASLSGEIKYHIDDQGTKMNSVESNIGRVQLNASMGENDIRMIEKVRAGQNRKVITLVVFCLLLLIFVIYLLYRIFS